MMAFSHSPLRYPGGKQILGKVLAHLVRLNGRTGGIYAEPYAGGAGAALYLLFREHAHEIILNDADPGIFAFWHSVLNRTDEFIEKILTVPLTPEEWQRQKSIYRSARHSQFNRGFATFFLNRCNRSGIIDNAGMIGGRQQTGKWKIDARFNREELAQRIKRISLYRERISLHNLDAIEFLKKVISKPTVAAKVFVYLDPPYFVKGSQLYLNHYIPSDHETLARFISDDAPFRWVMSYDNVPQIRSLYRGLRQAKFDLDYSVRNGRVGNELLIAPEGICFPPKWKRQIPSKYISASEDVTIPLAG